MNSKAKNAIVTTFFILLGVAFVFWFWSKLTPNERMLMWQSLSDTNVFWFALAIVVSLLSHYVRGLRWRLLGETFGCNVSKLSSFLAVMSGYLTNLAVPRLGEVVRCTMLHKSDNVPIDKSIGSVLTERAADMVLFLLFLIITLVISTDVLTSYTQRNFNADFGSYVIPLAICAIAFAVIVAVFCIFGRRLRQTILFKKIANFAKGLLQGIKSIIKLRRPWLFVFYSFAIWALWIVGTLCCFMAIDQTSQLNLIHALTTTVLGAFGPMITPGGIGLQPAIYAEVLQSFAIDRAIGYACGWLSWIASQSGTILVGLFAFVYFSFKKKSKDL